MTEQYAIRAEVSADHTATAAVHAQVFRDDRVPALVAALRRAPAGSRQSRWSPSWISRSSGTSCSARAGSTRRRASSTSSASRRWAYTRTIRGVASVVGSSHGPWPTPTSKPCHLFLQSSPRYYSRNGFGAASDAGFGRPSLRIPEAAFQVAMLSAYEPWMTGTFVYSETFWAPDCVGLR